MEHYVSHRLAQWLEDIGVELVFGVSGGGVAPIWVALAQCSKLRLVHAQHESGAAFAAAEASLASGKPVAVFVTTGPGLTNALTGIVAARREGARLIVLSGVTPAAHRFRGATQGCGPSSDLAALYGPGTLFDLCATIEAPQMLTPLSMQAAELLGRGDGCVVHFAVPSDVQSEPTQTPLPRLVQNTAGLRDDVAVPLARELTRKRVVIAVGFGARRAGQQITELAERLGAAVVVTPRAKGVVPDGHPCLAGVIGFGGHVEVERRLVAFDPEVLLAIGTRLGEGSSQWNDALTPKEKVVWINASQRPIVGALPVPSQRLVTDVRAGIDRLLRHLEPSKREGPRFEPASLDPTRGSQEGSVCPRALFDAIQHRVVDHSNTLIMAESGNAFAWAIHRLRMPAPRLRLSVDWGSMGHFCTGVIGGALGSGQRAVALVGDGSMLMGHELATAVKHRIDATWIVLNDSGYGMCRQAMKMQRIEGVDTELPTVCFAELAQSIGVLAETVTDAQQLDAAVDRATSGRGPRLLDIRIDGRVPAPISRRIQNLTWSGEVDEL